MSMRLSMRCTGNVPPSSISTTRCITSSRGAVSSCRVGTEAPTYAGLLAFPLVGINRVDEPILFRHPRYAGMLPETILTLEQYSFDPDSRQVSKCEAQRSDVLTDLNLVPDDEEDEILRSSTPSEWDFGGSISKRPILSAAISRRIAKDAIPCRGQFRKAMAWWRLRVFGGMHWPKRTPLGALVTRSVCGMREDRGRWEREPIST